jgi:UDP-N-acetylglucosamine 2-epimerase (non-hydrolysing)
MKTVYSIVGARPNFMKVAPVHRAFQSHAAAVRHIVVHTGQHYDAVMSDAFFKDLEMPEPSYFLNTGSGSHAAQTAKVMVTFEEICIKHPPDLVIVVGDVNSTMAAAVTAAKCRVKIAHIEAGLRSFDRAMPEEINRVVTDAVANYAFITEESGRRNLLNEGWDERRIFFVGNTMIDSLYFALSKVQYTSIRCRLKLTPKRYIVATLHRPTNVDDPNKLHELCEVLLELAEKRDVVIPLHPRTRRNLNHYNLEPMLRKTSRVHLLDPLGYVEFVALLREADFVLTDSGGIQEETTVLGIPCLTMRTTTERPVTCEIGTNQLVSPEAGALRVALARLLEGQRKAAKVPPLWDGHAAERIVATIMEQCLR